jgi:hypothetical protein
VELNEEGVPAAEDLGAARFASTAVSRYSIVESGGKPGFSCCNTPNITLVLDRGATIRYRMLRKMPRGTIFLDGAFAGAPFYDNKRRHYSLDHHEGCVRSFTLASCEQAAVILYQGIPLSDGLWTIFINDIDLDSTLAAWLLMNHTELLKDERRLLFEAMPLVRVEGAIDAQGIGAALLTGLPLETRAKAEGRLAELTLLARGSSSMGIAEASRLLVALLTAFDSMVIPSDAIAELLAYRELARARLDGGGIAIVARSDSGIYETEAFFKARLGEALGLLVLCQGEGRYSIRLVNRFLKDDLGRLFAYLNKRDPSVSKARDKDENSWGGSSNIGGSPRKTGSALPPEGILDAIEHVYGSLSTPWKRMSAGLAARFRP